MILNFDYSRLSRPGKINFGFNYCKGNTVLNVAVDVQTCRNVGYIESAIFLRRNEQNDERRRVNPEKFEPLRVLLLPKHRAFNPIFYYVSFVIDVFLFI